MRQKVQLHVTIPLPSSEKGYNHGGRGRFKKIYYRKVALETNFTTCNYVDIFKAILVWRLVREWIFMSRVAQEMQHFLKSLGKVITLEFPHTVFVSSLTQTVQLSRSTVLSMAKVIMVAIDLELCN